MAIKSVIFGIEGASLTREEYNFFKIHNPLGFILFTRNCQTKTQIKKLISQLKDCVGRDDLPILIDQEGGRVMRLKPPEFKGFPPAKLFADLAIKDLALAKEATYLNALLIADELKELGINFDCAPVADILFPTSHDIIGDRSFGSEAAQVIELAGSMAAGLIENGVVPIIKHIPGHGRATLDSHHDLPIIDTSKEELVATDFKVFKNLNHIPWAMTAHIVFSSIDDKFPVTFSPEMINLIRNELNYQGVIITDDLSMKALSCNFATRAQKSLEAGCDILLHCNGNMEEMEAIANNTNYINQRVSKFMQGGLTKAKPDIDLANAVTRLSKIFGV